MTIKLTESDVIEIKYRIAAGERQKDIAKSYDVQDSTISRIKNSVRWADVQIEIEFEKSKNFWSYASPELAAKIVDYYNEGYNQREVSDLMNKHALTIPKKIRPKRINQAYVGIILTHYGIKIRKNGCIYNHLLKDMKFMRKQGYTLFAIGKKLGIARHTVARYLRKK